jgi:hypothetical protein
MQTVNSRSATDWSREGPRTLIAKDGAVWIWPGIPLAMEQDGAVQPLPDHWVRSWVTALHGFEAHHARLGAALLRAAEHLSAGDEDKAREALDRVKIERLSPEGDALMRAVAAELGISPLDMAVGTKSLPWGATNHFTHLALFRRFGGAAFAFEKGGNPNQPRWPGGSPDSQGGRYAPANAGTDSTNGAAESAQPGIGHNGGPPLDDPPEVPEEKPLTAQLRNAIIKNVAGWLLRRAIVALIPGVGEVAAVIQLGVWLYEYSPTINAYLQPPQTLEELQNAASDPQPGYQIHHIVEQTPAENEGFPKSQTQAPENLVRISRLKHEEISAWYSHGTSKDSEFGGLSPRDYLRNKDWAEKTRVGLEAMVRFGVLKP